jgi:hypothetical protein
MSTATVTGRVQGKTAVALFNIGRPTVYRTLAAVETVAAQRSRR